MKTMTVNATETLQRAQSRSYESSHAELEPVHVLWALLAEAGVAGSALRSLELGRLVSDQHLRIALVESVQKGRR